MSNKFLIKKPLITEKATSLAAFNKYVFLVVKEADKCLAPHGLITNICYFLNKKSILTL